MIDVLLIAATTIQYHQVKKQNENYEIVGEKYSTHTIKGFNEFFGQIETKTQSATYQTFPIALKNIEDDFISPIKRSITVNATFITGSKILPLPMDDEDEIVYFDE